MQQRQRCTPIDIAFGTAPTRLARRPDAAEREVADPHAGHERPWTLWGLLLAVVAALVGFVKS